MTVLRRQNRSNRRNKGIAAVYDEYRMIGSPLTDYTSAFAQNYKVLFTPYPIPPIGQVDSGIATFSRLQAQSATRISLPCPFSWPVRLGNLKRCLLVERIPVSGSDKELVLMNLHLEAYDDGWQFLMDTTHPTCRSLDRPLDESDPSFQYYMIDGFILSPNLRADSIETLDLHFKNTDHNPVRLQVTLM